MPSWWSSTWPTLMGALGALLLLWLMLLILLWRATPNKTSLREALRLLPDVLRLIKRLAGDRSLPQGVRIRLLLLLAYLALPFDLVPDFIPVLGYADDAVVVLCCAPWPVQPAHRLCNDTGQAPRTVWPRYVVS